MRNWWDTLCRLGPTFGHSAEKKNKFWLILNKKVVQKAQSVFKNRNIKITAEFQRHLGAVIGLETFKQRYFQEKRPMDRRVACVV